MIDDEHAIAHLMRTTGCTRETAAKVLGAARVLTAHEKQKEDNKKTRKTRNVSEVSKGR